MHEVPVAPRRRLAVSTGHPSHGPRPSTGYPEDPERRRDRKGKRPARIPTHKRLDDHLTGSPTQVRDNYYPTLAPIAPSKTRTYMDRQE